MISRDWVFMIFNPDSNDEFALEQLRTNDKVQYNCHYKECTDKNIVVFGVVQLTDTTTSPTEMFTVRTWIKPCIAVYEAVQSLIDRPNFTAHGDLCVAHEIPLFDDGTTAVI